MPVVRVAKSAVIPAPADRVYALIADYREGHPRIVPKRYFRALEVERGGTGAGTIIRYRLRAYGMTREARAEVTEPVPGRVLAETDLANGTRTSFTVTPEEGGRAARVEIATEWDAKGLRGWVERRTVPRLLLRIFSEELANLASVAAEMERAARAPGPGPGPPR